jgi:hypothetical protein
MTRRVRSRVDLDGFWSRGSSPSLPPEGLVGSSPRSAPSTLTATSRRVSEAPDQVCGLRRPQSLVKLALSLPRAGEGHPRPVIVQRTKRVPPSSPHAATSPARQFGRSGKHASYLEPLRVRQLIPEVTVLATTKKRPRPSPLKRSPARSVPLDVHGSTKPSTCGYRCHASGGVACVPSSETSSAKTPRSSTPGKVKIPSVSRVAGKGAWRRTRRLSVRGWTLAGRSCGSESRRGRVPHSRP